jgi:hypothetical protein
MTKVSKPCAFLLYGFRIQPHKVEDFQAWAQERGMHFWEQHAGIIRYRTFRQQPELQLQEHLAGTQAEVHGTSVVEAEDVEALRRVLSTVEFQAIQSEFLQFTEPGSLKYSVLDCAYDSWITPVEATQKDIIDDLSPVPLGILHH